MHSHAASVWAHASAMRTGAGCPLCYVRTSPDLYSASVGALGPVNLGGKSRPGLIGFSIGVPGSRPSNLGCGGQPREEATSGHGEATPRGEGRGQGSESSDHARREQVATGRDGVCQWCFVMCPQWLSGHCVLCGARPRPCPKTSTCSAMYSPLGVDDGVVLLVVVRPHRPRDHRPLGRCQRMQTPGVHEIHHTITFRFFSP
jgi:hypothetical protein